MWQKILERQFLHLLALAILLVPVVLLSQHPSIQAGQFFFTSWTLFWAAIIIAIIHQIYVWFIWRIELHGDAISRRWPNYGFSGYKLGFSVIGTGRLVFLTWLAFANRGSLEIPETLRFFLTITLVLITSYAFYSVIRYFGSDRAAGIDHFETKEWSMVTEGIFKYTSNGMYLYAFLIVWVPGIWFSSSAAILAAAFQHAYIWVHYYCTELPDIQHIYGESPSSSRS